MRFPLVCLLNKSSSGDVGSPLLLQLYLSVLHFFSASFAQFLKAKENHQQIWAAHLASSELVPRRSHKKSSLFSHSPYALFPISSSVF